MRRRALSFTATAWCPTAGVGFAFAVPGATYVPIHVDTDVSDGYKSNDGWLNGLFVCKKKRILAIVTN